MKRCAEMSRKIRFFRDQMSKAAIFSVDRPSGEELHDLDDLEVGPTARSSTTSRFASSPTGTGSSAGCVSTSTDLNLPFSTIWRWGRLARPLFVTPVQATAYLCLCLGWAGCEDLIPYYHYYKYYFYNW